MSKAVIKGFDVQFCAEIIGVRTEFVVQRFVNKWLLIITQFEKISNLFTVQFDHRHRDETIPLPNYDDPYIPISITSSFGTDTDEARGAIKFLINKSNLCKCPSELVMSIGLKQTTGKVLREIAKVLNAVIEPK